MRWPPFCVFSDNAANKQITCMKIYVGNLSYGLTDDELNDIFSEYGQVASANIIFDKFSGKSKGFGFVEMPDDAEAERAIESLDQKEVEGRSIKVSQARPPQQNSFNKQRNMKPRY